MWAGTCCSPAPLVPGSLLRRPCRMPVPLLRGRAGECQTRTMWCQPLNWQPGGVVPVLQLGKTSAFLSPICLLTAWEASSLIICRGACWQLPSFLLPSLLSSPTPLVSKSEPFICLPPCRKGYPPFPPHPCLLSVTQATLSCPKNKGNWDWWAPPSPSLTSLLVQP